MADPRSDVDLQGIDLEIVTLKIDNSTITYDVTKANGAAATMIGKAVTFSAAKTVALCQDGNAVVGKLLSVTDDNFCTVQVGGHCDLPGGNGATLTLGEAIVGALGAASARGYIRAVATGTTAELGHARGRIEDATTTTAVMVDLD